MRAYAWFMVADDLGVVTAKDHMRNIRALISPQELQRAERLSKTLLKEEAASN